MNIHPYFSAALLVSVAFASPGQAAQLVGGASGSCVNLPAHGGNAADGAKVIIVACKRSACRPSV